MACLRMILTASPDTLVSSATVQSGKKKVPDPQESSFL